MCRAQFHNYRLHFASALQYASLFFIVGVGVDKDDENELGVLEFIHCLVETLDKVWLVHACKKQMTCRLTNNRLTKKNSVPAKLYEYMSPYFGSAFPSCDCESAAKAFYTHVHTVHKSKPTNHGNGKTHIFVSSQHLAFTSQMIRHPAISALIRHEHSEQNESARTQRTKRIVGKPFM